MYFDRGRRRHRRIVRRDSLSRVRRIDGPRTSGIAQPHRRRVSRARDRAPAADQLASGEGAEIRQGAARDASRPL